MMDFLKKFEIYLDDRVPKTLIHILRTAGYDSSIALKSLNPETINEMEIYISNLEQNFDGSSYTPFTRFLPGHRASLLCLPTLVVEYELETQKMQELQSSVPALAQNDPHFTFIMKQLIKTAKDNGNKDFRHRRFSEQLINFGMYLYMMCGKMSYEILSKNLPLPQASTICNLGFTIIPLLNMRP